MPQAILCVLCGEYVSFSSAAFGLAVAGAPVNKDILNCANLHRAVCITSERVLVSDKRFTSLCRYCDFLVCIIEVFYSAGKFCEGCACIDCGNTEENVAEVHKRRHKVNVKNPHAFQDKKVRTHSIVAA